MTSQTSIAEGGQIAEQTAPGVSGQPVHEDDTARDDDCFVLSPNAALFLAFRDVGYDTNAALDLADYAMAHPEKLLEDCKPSIARQWKIEAAARASAREVRS